MGNTESESFAVADRLAIADTLARYNRAVDAADSEKFTSLFTESGEWSSPFWGTFTGREAIRGFIDELAANKSHTEFRGGQHRIANVIIEELEPGRVSLWANWIVVRGTENGPKLGAMGNYNDILEKEGGRWLFARRAIEVVADDLGRLANVDGEGPGAG
jgi:uncharacterized protein (TIGR02246 family)